MNGGLFARQANCGKQLLVDRLQLLAGFEAYGLARRNADLSAGARVASDARLPRPDVEHAKAAQFNALTLRQRLLHALKHRFHGRFGFGLGDAGLVDHFVNDIELNHGSALLKFLRKGVTCRCYGTSARLSMEQFQRAPDARRCCAWWGRTGPPTRAGVARGGADL